MNVGDKVKHKTNNKYNGLMMTLVEIADAGIVCEYFYYQTKEMKLETFSEDDIEIVIENQDGFM